MKNEELLEMVQLHKKHVLSPKRGLVRNMFVEGLGSWCPCNKDLCL